VICPFHVLVKAQQSVLLLLRTLYLLPDRNTTRNHVNSKSWHDNTSGWMHQEQAFFATDANMLGAVWELLGEPAAPAAVADMLAICQ
jgi:hypothetical protein